MLVQTFLQPDEKNQHTTSYISTNITGRNLRRSRSCKLLKVFDQHSSFSPTYIFHQQSSPTLEHNFELTFSHLRQMIVLFQHVKDSH